MGTYVAFLRGINVGGRTKVKMDALRQIFEDLGHKNVTTYLQSGNVVFESPEAASAEMAGNVEESLAQCLDVKVTVILRTDQDLAGIAQRNPFLQAKSNPSVPHVTFLSEWRRRERVAEIERADGGTDELVIDGTEVYIRCPNGYGRTKLNNTFLERKLGVTATTRNWNTVTNLLELMR